MVMENSIRHARPQPISLVPDLLRSTAYKPYESPDEVLTDSTLTRAKKREILEFWASEICAVRSQPSMRQLPGSAASARLGEILKALHNLDGFDPEDAPFGGGVGKRPPMVRHRNWLVAGSEPSLEEALADPIVRQLMASDGLTEQDVRLAIAAVVLPQNQREKACA